MAESPKHALWLRPFGKPSFRLKELIHKLSKQFDTPLFEPHITLLSGLRQNETELIQLADTLAKSLDPFTIELTKTGCHDHYYQSVFVRVKKTQEFVEAQQIAEQLFDCSTDEKYFPHLSLLYGNISQNKKNRALNMMDRDFNISFPVHSILLLRSEGSVKEWEKIHSSEFKHTS